MPMSVRSKQIVKADASQAETMLFKNAVEFFCLLGLSGNSGLKPNDTTTGKLQALVKCLAPGLKNLIRTALERDLKFERCIQNSNATRNFLQKLTNLR